MKTARPNRNFLLATHCRRPVLAVKTARPNRNFLLATHSRRPVLAVKTARPNRNEEPAPDNGQMYGP